MRGTERAYGATRPPSTASNAPSSRSPTVLAFAPATRCPVLTRRMGIPGAARSGAPEAVWREPSLLALGLPRLPRAPGALPTRSLRAVRY
eukprot:1431718-Rhodomonas_salina.3